MDNIKVQQKTNEWSKTRRRKKLWQRVLAGMMSVVVFTTTYALILPAITAEQETFCGQEEHVHDDSCYERVLICGYPEEEPGSDLLLGASQAAHALEAEANETPAPTDETADETPAPADETPVPSDETPAEPVAEETPAPVEETPAPVDATPAPVEETSAPVDETPAPVEPVHVHTDACYELRLICGKDEHEHTAACFADTSVVEDAETWERSMSGVTLTGVWAEDVIAVAESQLGYTASEINYIVDDNGEVHNYTRYGAWYGEPYGDWCAMFASFVLNYAHVDRELVPIDANCNDWKRALTEKELWREAADYTPKPGDLVFFGDNRDGFAEHVGLVYRVETNDEGAMTRLITIEGNNGPRVSTFTYELETNDQPAILGYGALPENPNYVAPVDEPVPTEAPRTVYENITVTEDGELIDADGTVIGLVRLVAPETAEDETAAPAPAFAPGTQFEALYVLSDGRLVDGEGVEVGTVKRDEAEEPAEPAEEPVEPTAEPTDEPAAPVEEPVSLTAVTADGVTVTLTAEPSVLPYPVEELTLSVTPVEDEAAVALIESETETDDEVSRKTLLFDIRILHGEEEVQPLGPVTVTFGGIHTPNNDAQVFHVDTEAETVEEVTAYGESPDELAMETEHFSLYGVTFTYTVDFHLNNLVFSITGEDSIRLSALFEKLGVERSAAEAVSVVFTDESLLRVTQLAEESDWLLTSLAPFQTIEKLTVTFSDGETLEIIVTDATSGTWGTCAWTLDNNGLLTINAGTMAAGRPTWSSDTNIAPQVKKVVFNGNVVTATNCSQMFRDCVNLTSVNLTGLNTSNAENMGYMFYNCENLTSIVGIENLNTSKANQLSYMFYACRKLPGTLDLSRWNVSNVRWTSHTFAYCESLTGLNLTGWSTAKPETMAGMFRNCYSLASITGIEAMNTSRCQYFNGLFQNSSSLTSMNLSRWDVSQVLSFINTFGWCENLETLNLTGWNTGSSTNFGGMFRNTKLRSIAGLSNFDLSNAGTTYFMFAYNTALTALDLSSWNTPNNESCESMFDGCSNLETLRFGPNFKTDKVINMAKMFRSCESLAGVLDISMFNTALVQNMVAMFENCSSLTGIKFGAAFNTRAVENMSYMFYGVQLPKLNLCGTGGLNDANFDVRNVKKMEHMFRASGFKRVNPEGNANEDGDLNIWSWDTGKVENMYAMFSDMPNLTYLDVSMFNGASLLTMYHFVANNPRLEYLNVSFETPVLKYMGFFELVGKDTEEGTVIDATRIDLRNVCGQFSNNGSWGGKIKSIKIGPNWIANDNTNENGVMIALERWHSWANGIWKRLEDGAEFTASQMLQGTTRAAMPGTYVKVADNSLYTEEPISYIMVEHKGVKPGSVEVSGDYVLSTNEKYVLARYSNLTRRNYGEVSVSDGSRIRFVLDSAIEDAAGRPYDLEVIVTQSKVGEILNDPGAPTAGQFYDIDTGAIRPYSYALSEDDSVLPVLYDKVLGINPNGIDYSKTFWSDTAGDGSGFWRGNGTRSRYTVRVLNQDGSLAEEGNFVMAWYELDVTPWSLDWGEGINLISGYKADSLTIANPGYIRDLGVSPTGRWDGYRVMALRDDTGLETNAVMVAANSTGFTYEISVWANGSGNASVGLGQPSPVSIVKTRYTYPTEAGSPERTDIPLDGAGLRLERLDGTDWNLVQSWVSTDDPDGMRFFLVPQKEYRLTETSVPTGYKQASTVRFYVDPDYYPYIYNSDGTTTRLANQLVPMVDYPQTGSLSIGKIAPNRTPLPGAVFKVSGTSTIHGDFVVYSRDLGNGNYIVENIPVTTADGEDYVAEEVTPPAGYVRSTATKTFKILTDGQTLTGANGWSVTDEPTEPLRIFKYEQDSDPKLGLALVEFRLTPVNTQLSPVTDQTYSDGYLSFDGLVAGETYVLTETDTISGYKLNENSWRITVSEADGKLTVTRDGTSGTAPEWNATTRTLEIPNERETVRFTLTKEVVGDVPAGTEFRFKLEIEHDASFNIHGGTSAGTWSAGSFNGYGSSVHTWNMTITLQAGDSWSCWGVPLGAKLTLTETAHDGYYVRIKDGAMTLSSGDSYTWDTVEEEMNITVVNNAGTALPHTGGSGTALYSLGGLSLLALPPMLWLFTRCRKRQESF